MYMSTTGKNSYNTATAARVLVSMTPTRLHGYNREKQINDAATAAIRLL